MAKGEAWETWELVDSSQGVWANSSLTKTPLYQIPNKMGADQPRSEDVVRGQI